jgi:site-specific recombinase XerD
MIAMDGLLITQIKEFVKMKKTNDYAYLLTTFLKKYLSGQRNVSPNTIISYRDTFKQFMFFVNSEKKQVIDNFQMENFNRKIVIEYLDWIEFTLKNSINTRNQRLAAIKSFIRFIAYEMPEYMFTCQQIASIPMKKTQGRILSYFSPEGLQIYLNLPDLTTKRGRREHALLIVLYDSATRVQELIDLKIGDFKRAPNSILRVTGKGRKTRIIPLLNSTSSILANYIDEQPDYVKLNLNYPIFSNAQGHSLTRPGVTYIIKKYGQKMIDAGHKSQLPERLSPHCFRHTKSVHLRRAGVDLLYIRDILGHNSVTTTELYARVDAEEKRKALEEAYPIQNLEEIPKWESDSKLMSFLKDLCTSNAKDNMGQ